jgi:hypothetical protein
MLRRQGRIITLDGKYYVTKGSKRADILFNKYAKQTNIGEDKKSQKV